MTFPIRPIGESEWPAWLTVTSEAFGGTPPPPLAEIYKSRTEFDRTLAAFDGDLIVGTTGIDSFTMTVPGAAIPVAGVTAVTVLPSHRRRGILTSLMRRQLAAIRERGEAVAALYASESAIYGRYGYGRAASEMSVTINRPGSAFVPGAPVDPGLRLRVTIPADARADLARVFAEVAARRPGRYARNETLWDSLLVDEEFAQQGKGPLRCVVAEDGDGVRGYATFRIRVRWDDDGIAANELHVNEVEALDPAAYALLWRSMLDRDLVAKVHAGRPVDDPLVALLADARQLRASISDDLWVRLVDVQKALELRSYAAPVDVVVEVLDEYCPWNAGRWRLSGDTSGATCKPSEDEPDVRLPVAALGAAYLGDGQLATMLAAGLLTEHRAGAVRELATALVWSPKPWAGLVF
jgi:predicted acetyltransferase